MKTARARYLRFLKKARKFDLSSTRTETVRIEGVEVKVHFDANGWPVDASSPESWSACGERAMKLAYTGATRVAKANAKARSDAERTNKSTDTLRTKAAKHFSGKWLAAALKKNPGLGADRLAAAARRLVPEKLPDAEKHPDYERRAQITEYRAQQYLLKNKKKSGET